MYSELFFPLNSNDPVLLEIPVIITQGASERIRFPLDDLIYVEACQHRLILHTVQGDFSTRCTFASLTVCLASTGRFFRNGKGLLINFSHVALVQATGEVLLKTDRPSSAAADGSVKPAKPSSLMPEHCPAAYNMILIFNVLQPLIHRYKEQQPLVLFSNQRLLSCFCLFFSFSLPLPSEPQTAHRNRSLCHTEADKTASEFPC